MTTFVGIQFQKNGKIYNYDVNGFELRPDDFVIADTPHGMDLGQVVIGCRTTEEGENDISLRKIQRIATERDLQISAENRRKEREAFEVCQTKIAEHQLDMKLVSVEYAFDNSKALFYFTANGRVDFRSLVKDLASAFKMRIELRQIGVRDEARMLGGLGPCGRQICCGAFLSEFQPVSIKMAKEQNLSLNPTKISGVCGRLMCCLKYEQDHYEQTRKIMPRIGKEVMTPDGIGTVSDLNIVKETVFVRITNGDTSEIKEYPLEKIEKTTGGNFQPPRTEIPETENDEIPDAEPETEPRKPQNQNRQRKPRTEKAAGREPKRNENEKAGEGSGAEKPQENRENRKAERPESGRRNPALGKPVMRENPNRNTAAPAAATGEAKSAPAEAKEPEKKQAPATSWAEAVRKAIDSIS